jgi:hypothetical protein
MVARYNSRWIIDFKEHYNLCFNSSRKTSTYVSGIIQAIKVCAVRLGHNAEQWTNEKALDWAKAGFAGPVAPVLEGTKALSVPDVVCAALYTIRKHRQQVQSSNRCVPSDRQGSESSPTGRTSSDDLNKVKNGEMDIEKICLGCISSNTEIVGEHPYFKGSLCKNCMEKLNENIFAFGDDDIHVSGY